jgi:hypothetical protein
LNAAEVQKEPNDMLGEKLGEEHGKVTCRRVLPGDDYRYVKMEITFETTATILGQQGMNMGTYTIFERIPGQIYGEGRGIFMTADGQGAIWNGHGIGHATADGMGVAFAASVAFQTDSEKLARLNSVLVAVEHTTDGEGNAHSSLFEWKA